MKGIADEDQPFSTGSVEPTPATRAQRRAQFEGELLVHLDALYTFGLKLARIPTDAEDIVSETIVRAFDHWEQYRLGTNVRAWMFTILYRVFVTRQRTGGREVFYSDIDEVGPYVQKAVDSDPEGEFYEAIVDAEVTRALDSLPTHYREAVLLSDVHEFRYTEIASILGVPEGTAKSRLFRGRQMLQRKLLRYAVEMGYVKPRAA